MSNSNDNKEISSNISSNAGPSSSVESPINDRTKKLENIDTNKASTKTFISKVIAIEGPRENENNVLIDQANTASVSEEPNASTYQNSGASSSDPFNPGTFEIIESIINFSTAKFKNECDKDIVIPQAIHLLNNQANTANEGNISEASGNVNQNTENQTELPLQSLQSSHTTPDSRLAEGNIHKVNQTAASVPQQPNENQSSIGNTPDLTPNHNDDGGNDKNDKNVIITQAIVNENLLANQLNTVNNTATGIANVSTPQTESNESISDLQVTTSIYLSNNPSGLPYSPSQNEQQNTEHRHRQERIPYTVSSIPQLLNSPRGSARNCSLSACNLTAYQNVIPALITDRCDLSGVPESDIEVNITALPVPPLVIQGPPPIAGAPPTYSAVMRLGPEDPRPLWTQSIRIQPSPPFIAPIPPPPYTEIQGMHTDRPMLVASADQMIWGPDPISVVCPRCANVVVTSTQSQRSNLTHFSALALCLCGCWPCCLLPYCMDSCKNTYHHCPTCQQFLGMYRPW